MTKSEIRELGLACQKEIYLERLVDETPGWLDRYAAKRTMDLLDYQEKNGVTGSLFEIGVYCGKYLLILLRSAARTGEKLVALDTFDYISAAEFERRLLERLSQDAQLEKAFSSISILAGPSGAFSSRQLMQYLGQEVRFASIDGSHEYDDVLWDLSLADEVLAAKGIVAVDDFLHPICLGVTAAVFHYLENNPTLVPFAYVSNKLFLSRPACSNQYRDILEAGIVDDAQDARSIEYCENVKNGTRSNIEALFRGYRVLTIRL